MTDQILPGDYGQFSSLLERYSGITLREGKEYLVQSRLKSVLQHHQLTSYSELVHQLESNPTMQVDVVDAMTTNETLWFRDDYPYQILRNRLLPELSQSQSSLRIWSAACSTGQEPYSIGMEYEAFLKASAARSRVSFEIIASDISKPVLQEAEQGIYHERVVQRGMRDVELKSYFERLDGDTWQIKPNIRQYVTFKQQNLQDSFTHLRPFDVIFCRNVLIYFSHDNKLNVLKRMHAQLKKGGYLILGASETMYDLEDYFDVVACNPGFIYQAR